MAIEETAEADETHDHLPQFSHPATTTSSTPNHNGRQYTYAWDSYNSAERHDPHALTPSHHRDISRFPSYPNTPTYSPFPINQFTPGYPLYLRPESPVSTPQIRRSVSSDLVLGLTDAEQLEAKFAARLFDDIIPGSVKGRRTRAVFRWPIDVTAEDRLLVVLRCMKNSGFDTIGEMLSVMFSKEQRDSKSTRHLTVSHSISAFLRGQSIDPRTSPLAIVDAIYRHPSSQTFTNRIPSPVQFNLPRYARLPSERLLSANQACANNTTRNALLDWSLTKVLHHVDKEADALLHPVIGLTSPPHTDQKLSWSIVLGWSLTRTQEIIAKHSPMIFAILTTISVSRRARKQLQMATSALHPDTEGSAYEDQASNNMEDSSDEEDGTVPMAEPEQGNGALGLGNGVPTNMRRDPWLGVTVSVLMLLYFRYRFAVLFPTLVGLFLFTCNANRDIFAILGRMGLSIAYSSVLSTLHLLATDSDAHLRTWGALMEIGEPKFLLLFDNVNKMQRAWQSTIGREDEVKSGTAATLIKLEDVPLGAMLAEPLLKNLKEKVRGKLTVEMLMDDINWAHVESIGAATVLRVWTRHISALARFRGAVDSHFSAVHARHPLRLRKSEIHPMRTTDIDEATTTGVASVLGNMIGQLGIVGSWLNKYLVLVCGDQLSVDRIRKVKLYTGKAATAYDRHEWALPVIQLWHMKWALQKAVFRLHWWDSVGKEIFGVRHDCDLLGRGKFNPVKCDFYPAHHILEDRFDALILDALRIICEERTKIIKPPTKKLLEGLEEYFVDAGPFTGITFDGLCEIAEVVYNRYMCNAAHDSALGYGDRDPALYGPPNVPNAPGSGPTPSSGGSRPISELPDSKQPKKRARNKATAAEVRNFSQGDQSLATTINFLRITFWYLEMCAAAAEGDIGRIFEIIKLLRFSFWGAGSTNYGNELLELACNFLLEFPPALKTAILNNYLVNPSGLRGHWLELDLLQEHFNFWIKRLFNSKSHDFDAKHLSEAVSLNIGGFSALRDRFPALFGAKKNSHRHTDADKRDDIDRLGVHYRHDKILSFIPKRNQAYSVRDEFSAGYDILAGGQLRTFLDRTTGGGFCSDDSVPGNEDEDARAPANPIILSGGVMDIDPFIGDDVSTY